MHSPLGSPHAGSRAGVAAALAAAASASGMTVAGGRSIVGGRVLTPSSTTASTTPGVSPANSTVSGTQYQGVLLGAGGMAGLTISGPRIAVSPRQGGGISQQAVQDFAAAFERQASGMVSAPVSGASTPHDRQGLTAAQLLLAGVPQQHPPQPAAVRVGSSVDALAQDLSTLLSASGLRALSAKLAALADQVEQRGPQGGGGQQQQQGGVQVVMGPRVSSGSGSGAAPSGQ